MAAPALERAVEAAVEAALEVGAVEAPVVAVAEVGVEVVALEPVLAQAPVLRLAMQLPLFFFRLCALL